MRLLPLWVLISGCAATRAVAPLPRGQGQVTSSLGGPVFLFGSAPIPVPLATVGYRHGVTDHTAIKGSLHATPLLVLGVGAFDLGADTEILPPKGARPRLMVDQTVTFTFGDADPEGPEGGLAVFPSAGLLASWDVRRHHLYAGIQVFDQLVPDRVTYPYPLAGGILRTGRVGWQLEVGWPALTSRNLPNFLTWVAPAHRGAISLHLGLTVDVGGR